MPRFAAACRVAVATVAIPTVAHAADDKDTKVALTFSPIHLILPMGEVTGEVRLAEKASVAVIAGYGATSGVTLWELGGQGRFYLLGDFADGLMLGGEVIYLGAVSGSASAVGVSPGAFVGGKTTFDFGLVLDAQIGGMMLVADGAGIPGLLLNLNIGWAF